MKQYGKKDGMERVAKALGWFGIALGVAEMAGSRTVARLIGVRSRPQVLPALGAREVISGIGILAQKKPAAWMWSRVVGDGIDLGLLRAAAARDRGDSTRLRTAGAAVLGVTLLDAWCAYRLSRDSANQVNRTVQTITIARPPEQLYQFWRELENLPRVMSNVESIRETGPNRSH